MTPSKKTTPRFGSETVSLVKTPKAASSGVKQKKSKYFDFDVDIKNNNKN